MGQGRILIGMTTERTCMYKWRQKNCLTMIVIVIDRLSFFHDRYIAKDYASTSSSDNLAKTYSKK